MEKNPLKVMEGEPVLTATVLAPGLIFLFSIFGLSMDFEQAVSLAALILGGGVWYSRQHVSPTAK